MYFTAVGAVRTAQLLNVKCIQMGVAPQLRDRESAFAQRQLNCIAGKVMSKNNSKDNDCQAKVP